MYDPVLKSLLQYAIEQQNSQITKAALNVIGESLSFADQLKIFINARDQALVDAKQEPGEFKNIEAREIRFSNSDRASKFKAVNARDCLDYAIGYIDYVYWFLIENGEEATFKEFDIVEYTLKPQSSEITGPYGQFRWDLNDLAREQWGHNENPKKGRALYICAEIIKYMAERTGHSAVQIIMPVSIEDYSNLQYIINECL